MPLIFWFSHSSTLLFCFSLVDSPSDTATAMEVKCAAFSWVPVEEEGTRQPSSTGTLQLHIENLSVRKVSKDMGQKNGTREKTLETRNDRAEVACFP